MSRAVALRSARFLQNFRAIKSVTALALLDHSNQVRMMSNDSQQPGWGSGSGKGGGSGGSVRDAGGAFGKRQATKEEEYFRQQTKSQLDTLKKSLTDEIEYHEDEIEDHQEAIERHKRKLKELEELIGKKD